AAICQHRSAPTHEAMHSTGRLNHIKTGMADHVISIPSQDDLRSTGSQVFRSGVSHYRVGAHGHECWSMQASVRSGNAQYTSAVCRVLAFHCHAEFILQCRQPAYTHVLRHTMDHPLVLAKASW